jgi:hypothetical protein
MLDEEFLPKIKNGDENDDDKGNPQPDSTRASRVCRSDQFFGDQRGKAQHHFDFGR